MTGDMTWPEYTLKMFMLIFVFMSLAPSSYEGICPAPLDLEKMFSNVNKMKKNKKL